MASPQYSVVPENVSNMVQKGVSPLKAWREYKELSVDEMALRLDVSSSVYEQAEEAKNLGLTTLQKAAIALGVEYDQLKDLY